VLSLAVATETTPSYAPRSSRFGSDRPLWRMMSRYGATQSWVACQKRRRLAAYHSRCSWQKQFPARSSQTQLPIDHNADAGGFVGSRDIDTMQSQLSLGHNINLRRLLCRTCTSQTIRLVQARNDRCEV